MRLTLLAGVAALALAGYGVYDYTKAAPTPVALGADATPEDLAKNPPADAKEPSDLAKNPPSEAKEPGDLGTILD